MGTEKESKVIIKDFDDILGNLSLYCNCKPGYGANSPKAESQQLSMSSHILQHHIGLVISRSCRRLGAVPVQPPRHLLALRLPPRLRGIHACPGAGFNAVLTYTFLNYSEIIDFGTVCKHFV